MINCIIHDKIALKKLTWKKAKQICRDNGGRLPTIEELREVVMDCGGISYTWGKGNYKNNEVKNIANKSYQSCYKQKGFTSNNYWSSTTNVSDSSNAGYVYFYYGYDYWDGKGGEYYIRCVRGGQ